MLGGAALSGTVGIVLLLLFVRQRHRFRNLAKRGVKVQGFVVERELDTDGVPYITVEYRDHLGNSHRNEPGFGSSYFPDQGTPVEVTYDRDDPTLARVEVAAKITGKVLPMVGGMCLGMAALFVPLALFVMAPLDDAVAAMNRAVDAFFDEARRGTPPPERTTTTEHAVIDEAFVEQHVRSSTGFRRMGSASGFDDGCVEGALLPSRQQVVLYLQRVGKRWKVVRAGHDDPECDDRLED
ncbi:MAG: DUF3592 domain-containing protein [Polyangiaceae bacterium]